MGAKALLVGTFLWKQCCGRGPGGWGWDLASEGPVLFTFRKAGPFCKCPRGLGCDGYPVSSPYPVC